MMRNTDAPEQQLGGPLVVPRETDESDDEKTPGQPAIMVPYHYHQFQAQPTNANTTMPPTPITVDNVSCQKGFEAEQMVCLIDYDGCMDRDTSNIQQHCLTLLNAHPAAMLELAVGSARQSRALDACGWSTNIKTGFLSLGQNGSCFVAMGELWHMLCCDYLQQKAGRQPPIVLNKFLLEDIQGNRRAGHYFDQGIKTPISSSSDARLHTSVQRANDMRHTWNDTSKKALLYAHIHECATRHPDKKILVNFYDDREDILQALHQCYRTRPDLLPKNVRLQLHCCQLGNFFRIDTITDNHIDGTGALDPEFRKTVQSFTSEKWQALLDSAKNSAPTTTTTTTTAAYTDARFFSAANTPTHETTGQTAAASAVNSSQFGAH